ncbi:permease-like cell division protein FtsX [Marinobacteraceae bacterium S3BR75-40.1]
MASSEERQDVTARPRGAALSQRPLREQLESYLAHHRKTARDSAQRMVQAPLASLTTWMVMGIALALPLCLLLLLHSLQSVSAGWEEASRVTVYLEPGVDRNEALSLRSDLLARRDIAAVDFLPKEEALAEFRAGSGLGEALDFLGENPLPHTLILSPVADVRTSGPLRTLVQELQTLPGVDRVQLDLEWLQRLNALADILGRGVLALGGLLAAAVVLVIGNTIRLSIESRRDEILVAKLVGGTDAFVRRPFLYTGVWFGFGGSVVAWWLVEIALWWMNGPVERLANLYGSQFQLQGLGFEAVVGVLLLGMLLGWLGAWVAVKRHLSAIEPT